MQSERQPRLPSSRAGPIRKRFFIGAGFALAILPAIPIWLWERNTVRRAAVRIPVSPAPLAGIQIRVRFVDSKPIISWAMEGKRVTLDQIKRAAARNRALGVSFGEVRIHLDRNFPAAGLLKVMGELRAMDMKNLSIRLHTSDRRQVSRISHPIA